MFLAKLMLFIGCQFGLQSTLDDTGVTVIADTTPAKWTVEPAALALGTTDVDVPLSGAVILTNTGDQDLLVLGLGESTEEHLEVELTGEPVLAPGRATQLDITWTPAEPGSLESAVAISVGTSSTDAQPVDLAVSGTAMGAVATVSASVYDFGEVDIGCDGEFSLTLTNTGNTTMQVDSVALHGNEAYWLEEPEDLPWTVSPWQSQQLVVHFSPDELGEMFTDLEFETDLGTIQTNFEGEGVVDQEHTVNYTVGELSRSTIIWNINLTAIPDSSEDQYSHFFVAALPTFFETLLENHASYRASFVWNVSGEIDGDPVYIDESYSAEDATAIALDMIAPGKYAGDNDANFTTLLNTIAANTDWLFEDDAWSEAPLHLITVQRDTEASGGNWATYVSQAQSYKDDPEDVVFHAIAGPVPGGCGSAEAFADYHQAVNSTGGVFRSICEPDWTDAMTELAAACIEGANTFFQLEGTPMESSIEVTVDGSRLTEGWSYDSSMNAVVFEDGSYPTQDATVSIYYWMSDGCE